MGCATLPADVEALLTSVRATSWSVSKVSAIDLASDFVWIDDEPLAVEVEVLRGRNLLRRLVVIDTNKDDDGLVRHSSGYPVLRGTDSPHPRDI